MLCINIASLKEGMHVFELQPTASDLELDPNMFRGIGVKATLDYSPGRILVKLEAQATATLECDRTLVLFDTPVFGTYCLLFAPPELAQKAGEGSDEVRPLYPTDREIDLTDVVRDTLMLALPQRRIAPEAEALEIPTRFGDASDAEPIDPRWEALRKLRSEDQAG
jgi:uncharacterized protein